LQLIAQLKILIAINHTIATCTRKW